MASMITISLYHLADTFWVAKLGPEAIAAITVTFPFFIATIAFGIGTGVGANALASRRFGERNVEAGNRVAGQVFSLAVLMGAVFIVMTTFFSRQIALICGATPDILDMATDYLWFFGWGVPFLLFRLIIRNVFQASGDAVKPMVFTIISAVINVILDPFFIFGWGPFPELGVGGAALATAISMATGTLIALYYLLAKKSAYRLKAHHLVPDFTVIREIYRVGLPSIFMPLTESVVFTLFNRVVAGFGSTALAALGIAIRISDIAFMPIIGVSHGLLPIIGFSFGARLWRRLWSATRLATLSTVVLLVMITIALEVFAPQLIRIFNDDADLLAVAVPGMRIVMSGLVLVGPAIIFITTFQGLSRGWTASVLSLGRQLVFFLPALFILPRFLGLNGVWWSLPLSDALGLLVSGTWLYREYSRHKQGDHWEKTPSAELIPTVPAPRIPLD
ncbi:MATE family efflux transporter [Chloroflexota bacterium]